MDRIALLAGTLASAARLRRLFGSRANVAEASSVVGTALDLADPVVRERVRELLEAHDLLGADDHQFPTNPWIFWDERLDEPVFTLLRSVPVNEDEAQRRLRETPLPILLTWTTPAMVLAALGVPHRSIVLPKWVLPTIAGALAVVGVGVVLKWRD